VALLRFSQLVRKFVTLSFLFLALLYLPFTYHQTYAKRIFFQITVLLVTVAVLSDDQRKPRLPAAGWLLLSYLVLSLISCFWAFSWRATVYENIAFCFWIVWAVGLFFLLDEEGRRTAFMGIVWAGVATAAVGFVLFCYGWMTDPGLRHDPTFRLVVPWRANPNLTAALMITPLVYFGLKALTVRKRRLPFGCVALFLFACFLMTRSASGMLGLIGAGAMVFFCSVGRRARRLATILVIAVLVAWFIWFYSTGADLDALLRSIALGAGETVRARYYLIRDALRMAAVKPLLGWGTGNFISIYPAFRSPEEGELQLLRAIGNHTHNEPLQILVETGFIGLTIYVAFLCFLIVPAARLIIERRDLQSFRLPLLAGFVGMTVQGFFYVGLRFWDVAPFYWAHAGLLLAGISGATETERASGGRSRISRAALAISLACCGLIAWRVLVDFASEVNLARGYTAYMKGNNAAAVPELEKAFRRTLYFPDRVNSACYLAMTLANVGRFDEAIRLLEGLQKEADNIGNSRYILGRIYYERFKKTGDRRDLYSAFSNLRRYVGTYSYDERARKLVNAIQSKHRLW